MKNHLAINFLFLALTLAACSKDDAQFCETYQYLGTYGLMESSRSFLDYQRFDKIQMTNSNGDEISLDIKDISNELQNESKDVCRISCAEDDSQYIESEYQREISGFDIIGDLEFRAKVGVVGFRVVVQREIDPAEIADDGVDNLEISLLITSSNEKGYVVSDSAIFKMSLWDYRTSDMGQGLYIEHDVLKFKTRWYKNVFEGPLSEFAIKLYVMKGLGIVAVETPTLEQIYLERLL